MPIPNLRHTLQNQDTGYLRIVAEFWGIEISASDIGTLAEYLSSVMQNPALFGEIINGLPVDALNALQALQQNGGRLLWSTFTRRFGKLREMGSGRRDRERPYLNPISATEVLWYRALIGRTFFDTEKGAEEFAYLPREFMAMLPPLQNQAQIVLGRRATPKEYAYIYPADDRILDYACTLLAALRIGIPLTPPPYPLHTFCNPLSPATLKVLLNAAGLLDPQGIPLSEPTRAFLESNRAEALATLTHAWRDSTTFNELRLIPGLRCEGEWVNDPLTTRQTIVNFLSAIPHGTWWHLGTFLSDIRKNLPDFQRPAGDYDSWFIRDESTGEYLRGFESWNKVEGELIRYMITGPMHWLGILDLAAPGKDQNVTAFRFSHWADKLLRGDPPDGLNIEDETFLISRDGRIRVPKFAPRAARYLLARFSAWEGEDEEGYRYRICAASLERAKQQGLQVRHLITLLKHHALAVPPSLIQALQRWEKHGNQAILEHTWILRVGSPRILQQLRASRANRFLGEQLNPQTILVKPGAADKVLAILAELGYLGDIEKLE